MQEQPAFGHTLLVDKPLHWTSFDVVNKLRYAAKRISGRKKMKVGHAGTLDPLATGLMIVCVGKDTKTIESLMGLDKSYTGTIELGATTPSFDLETEIDTKFDLPTNDQVELQAAADTFIGKIEQVPPIFSAKKVDGKKAYELARKGKEVALKAAQVRIDAFAINAESFPSLHFSLDCSKGTYVRSLAHDYGKALGGGAHLSSLRRTRIGPYTLDNAGSIEDCIATIEASWLRFAEADS